MWEGRRKGWDPIYKTASQEVWCNKDPHKFGLITSCSHQIFVLPDKMLLNYTAVAPKHQIFLRKQYHISTWYGHAQQVVAHRALYQVI